MSISFRNNIIYFLFIVLSIFIWVKGNADDYSETYAFDSAKSISLCDSAINTLPDIKGCFSLLKKAEFAANKSDCKSCVAEVNYSYGVLYYEASKYDSAIIYFKSALSSYIQQNNIQRIIDANEYIGYSQLGLYNYNKGIIYAEAGLKIADSLGFGKSIANLHLLIGSCYDEMGLYDKSTYSLMKALSLFEEEKDSAGISSVLINLGMIFSNDYNYIDALNYTNRALQICKIQDDQYGISACLNNIGDIYGAQKDYLTALNYFKNSLEIDKELNDINGIAIGLNNIGDTYRSLKDTVLAISYYQKSLEIAKQYKYPVVSVVLSNMGEVQLDRGDHRGALEYLTESLEIAEKTGYINQIINCYNLLGKAYSMRGDYANAYNYFVKYHRLHDSINSVNKSRVIQEMKAKYNDEKQRTEIDTLKDISSNESIYRRNLILIIIVITIMIVALLIINSINRNSRRLVKKQKLYYEKLLDRSEDFIFVISKEGLVRYISPSYERRIGREIATRIGKSAFEFIHKDDVEFVKQEFNILLNDKQPRNIDFRLKTAFGQWMSVYAYGQNLIDDEMINGIAVNFWDITQRKKNEELISQSEIKFRQIFNAFPDIYFQADTKGVITEVSPSVYKITGYTREEVIGVSSKEYYHFVNDWKKIAARFETSYSVNDHDTKIKRKDGSIIHCSFTAELIFDENDKPTGIKGVLRDITSRVISQKKLHDSQMQLKEANSAKEKIFSIIAHDLIGPIGTNKSIVDLIVSQVDELSHDEIITLITSLKPSLDSTYSLIENLLSWARIQQNRLKPNFEVISVNAIIDVVVGLLEGQAMRKSISLVVEAEKHINIFADKNQIDIVLRNLVSNAIKFSNKGSEVLIQITSKVKIAEISITDTGIGMNQEQVESIVTGKGSSEIRRGTDNEKGTGFGLVIVNEFVKNNFGQVIVVSKLGVGTTFRISLPIKE
jgi:PAS domain S-box-containing protein